MKPRDVIKTIIDTSVAEIVRDAGFKKSRYNFFRRKDFVVQVINIQLSRWNRDDQGAFYVNIALAFDELRTYEAIPIIETPKEYECDLRRRLEHLVPDTPTAWEVSPQVDSKLLTRILLDKLGIALRYLDKINTLPAFLEIALEESWFALPGEYDLLSRLQDAIGDVGAAKENQRLYDEFLHHRDTMSPDEFLNHYGFEPIA